MACDYNNKVLLVPGTLKKESILIQQGTGNGGDLNLPISSDDVLYNGQTLTVVLDGILYVAPVINSFTTAVTNYQKGVILNTLFLEWGINKTISTQEIGSSEMSAPINPAAADRNATVNLTAAADNFSIVLTITDSEGAQDTAEILVKFIEPVYYGVAQIPGSLNSAFINNLTSVLIENTAITQTVNLGPTQYFWYAVPQSRVSGGLPDIKINDFSATMEDLGTISHSNTNGHTADYRILRSEFDNLGTTKFEIS